MNILPKKKWHVRTKENVARVRRDQKRAAEEAERVAERAKLAEQEFKVNILRKNADKRVADLYGVFKEEASASSDALPIIDPTGHVNFFMELEEETRKNYGAGNKDYAEEKRKEKEEYESKVGILKYLGEGSNEYTKQKSWYEKVPEKGIEKTEERGVSKTLPCGLKSIEESREILLEKNRKHHRKKEKERSRHKEKKHHDERKKRKHEQKRSSDFSADDNSYSKKSSGSSGVLERLRLERLKREEAEREKVAMLLLADKQKDEGKCHKTVPKYSSQFNPDLARQNLR